MLSLAPTVCAARTAMPSIADASKDGDERVAHTGSAVTRPTAPWSAGPHGVDALGAAGRRAGRVPRGERLRGGDVVDERRRRHYAVERHVDLGAACRPVASSGTTT